MYYQYGYYKPLVAKKLDRVMTLRQLVPGLFLLSLAGTAALAPWLPMARVAGAALPGSYVPAVRGCAAGAARRTGSPCSRALAAGPPAVGPRLRGCAGPA